MKKKLMSLALALALCLSLSVPALASGHELYIVYENGEMDSVISEGSGEGWSFKDSVLTLNGLKDAEISFSFLENPVIVLAPGSKNVATGLNSDESENPITIKGSGELILSNPNPSEYEKDNGVLYGSAGSVNLQDGLVMAGGTKEGDSGEVTYKKVGESFPAYKCMAGGELAWYVRIAPKGGAKPTETQNPAASGFTDVAANSPYAEAIKWAVDQKITTGKTSATFGPSDPCTNRHILTFLWRANGKPSPVASGTDWNSAFQWGYTMGLLSLSDFPDKTCTRVQAVWALWIASHQPKPSKPAAFTDMPDRPGLADAISWAVENGITSGTSATEFSPDAPCTRGQIVTFLYRAMK